MSDVVPLYSILNPVNMTLMRKLRNVNAYNGQPVPESPLKITQNRDGMQTIDATKCAEIEEY